MAKRRNGRRANGEGACFPTTKNGRPAWCAELTRPGQYTASGRPRVRRGYRASQAEALALLDEWRAERRESPDVDPGRATVADLVELYLEHKARSLEVTSLETERHDLNRYVKPSNRLGRVALGKLTSGHVLRWLAQLDATAEDPAKGRRARQSAFDALSRVCVFGVKPAKLLRANPCDGIDRPKYAAPEVAALSREQARTLLDKAREAGPHVEAAVALGLCGLRRAEVFGLDWRHVDLDAGTLRVEQAFAEPAKGPAFLKAPKTQRGRRTVPLTPQAVEALRRHRAAELRRHLATKGRKKGRTAPAPEPDRAVFVSDAGTRRLGSNFTSREFSAAVSAAGLSCTFHMLRHTCATLLLGAGVDVKSVQAILGHSRASMTLDRYGHAIPSNIANAGATLGNVLAGS